MHSCGLYHQLLYIGELLYNVCFGLKVAFELETRGLMVTFTIS